MSDLVSPQWLADRIDDRQIVIADCRFSLADPELGHQQYLANHLPNAFYLNLDGDLSSPVGKVGGRHPLPDPQKLSEKLAAMGVNFGETMVVAYDDTRMAFAARLWWLLRYFGHDRVAILDGGWTQWQALGYPVTNTLPQPQPGQFSPQLRSQFVADLETVKKRKDLDSVVLVDSRDRDRFLGEREPIDPVAGHIPGALNYPWKEVTQESSLVCNEEAQKQRWSDLEDAEEIVVYCGSGVTACVNLLSLKLAGIDNAKLYPGGWSDWCSRDLPIETGETTKP